MSYCWFNTEKVLKNVRHKYYNRGGKKNLPKYYRDNMKVLREDAINK